MRLLFFLLVLVNLLFYGWHAGYIGPGESSRGEGDRLSQQITPERIRVLTPAEAKKLTDEARARANVCFEWGTFPAQEADKAATALAALGLGTRLNTRTVEETAGWWVFMPPQGGKENADKKVDELRRIGVSDFFVVLDDGPAKFSISLGVFRSEDAARSFLANLTAKGVNTARAAQRETRVQKTLFRLTGLDDAAMVRFDAIKRDFSGYDTRDCTAGEGAERKADEKKAADKKADDKKADDKKVGDKKAGG